MSTKPITIPNTFATASTAIPLSQLDNNFTTITSTINDANTYSNYAADTGTANVYIVTFSSLTTTYSSGLRIQFKATNSNTTASTLNVNNQGAKSIVLTDGSALPSGAIVAGAIVDVMYDGTNFQLLSDSNGGGEVITNLTVTGNATVAGTTTLTGNLTVDTNVLFVDTSANNVGIGTSSPSYKLDVRGRTQIINSAAGTSTVATFCNDDTSGTSVVKTGFSNGGTIKASINAAVYGNDYMTFNVGSDTERMRIDSSGNVGIGTTSPSSKLTVAGDARVSNGAMYITRTSYPLLEINQSGSTGVGQIAMNGNNLEIRQTQAYDTLFYTNNTEAMRINSAGNVGIGTSSPAQKVEVANNGYLALRLNNSQSGAWKSEFQFSNGGNLKWSVGTDITSSGNNNFYFYDNVAGQQRMSIDSSGNLLVNTTDTTMFNNTSGNGMCYRVNSSLDIATSSDNCLILNRMTSTGPIAEFRYAGTIVGSITVSGSATAYVTSSDYRLKENIAPMTGALDVVAQLKPVKYNWKVDGSDGQGFIAHELQEVVPDCVSGEKDAVDEEGNPVYQGIDTSFLVATLTAAIQELKAELDVVKAELNTLKGN